METKTLVVNGIPRQVLVDSDTLLVDVLRNQLQITSVKVGCGQGQCGACSVILDGKVTRACIVKMRRVPDQAQITTLEGVGTPAKLHPLQESWMFHGAAQCGFCTPGFIVSAKALLDSNPAPSREEVRDWFQKHHNICRCTGYKPLVDAVMDAAAVMRGDKDIEELRYKLPADGRAFGSRLPRPSALVKVTGLAEYGADAAVHMPPDTLHLALAQAKVSHAIIKGIDTSEAEKMPGVVRVLTHKDVKGKNRITGLITFADNNAFLKGTVTKTAADAATNPNSAVLTVVTNTAAFGTNTELSDIVDEHLGTDTNDGLRNLLLAVGNEQGDFIQNGLLTSRGERALEEVFALPVTAGTYNVAYDAAEQATGAIQRHNTAALQGTGVWADVYYSSNAGKEIYGGQGYSADIYGGVIGVDYTAACGAKMGVALTVGTGDADSEKSVSKFGNDADFYGLSVYAGKNVGDTSLYVSADASYLWLEKDITGNVAGASAAESIDSSVFTIGLRADWAAYAGDVMSVTPHVGLRYTNIDVDSYRGLDTGAMDLVEMPVGVKVAGNFETAGWKVTPAVDFTVVPQVGDKQVDTVVGAVDVIDNLYNTTLGVSAEYGNFTFGLNYRYGFGNNDRKNNSVNANVRYMF